MTQLSTNATYNPCVALIRTLRDTAKPVAYGVNCFGDGFTDQTGINATASANVLYDPRHVVSPSRSGTTTVGSDDTTSTATWTGFSSGTASVTAVADPNNPVIPGNNVFLFDTGATLGSVAGVQKNFGTIPDAAFSVGIHIDIENTGTDPLDCFEGQMASVSGYNVQFRVRSGSFEVFQDGAWQQMSTYGGGNLYTEWWINAQQVSSNNYTVSVYAGTQLLGTRTGLLPGGGNPGLIVLQKNSGATANQTARVAFVNVGSSQRADNLSLVSVAAQYLSASPANARLIALVEDTALYLNTNTNLTGSVSQDGGTTWESVTFTDLGVFSLGVIDDTKEVHMLVAEHVFTNTGGTAPAYKIESSQNWWFGLLGTYLEWY